LSGTLFSFSCPRQCRRYASEEGRATHKVLTTSDLSPLKRNDVGETARTRCCPEKEEKRRESLRVARMDDAVVLRQVRDDCRQCSVSIVPSSLRSRFALASSADAPNPTTINRLSHSPVPLCWNAASHVSFEIGSREWKAEKMSFGEEVIARVAQRGVEGRGSCLAGREG
jgi:hypothetical protein